MELFKRRPFMICCTVFISVFALLFFLKSEIKLAVLAVSALICVSVLISFAIKKQSKRRSLVLALFGLYMFFCALAAFESYLYFDVVCKNAFESHEEESCIEMTVTSVRSSSRFESSYYAKLSSVDGEKASGKIFVTFDAPSYFNIGDKIRIQANQTSLKEICQSNSEFYTLVGDGIRRAFCVTDTQLQSAAVIGEGLLPLRSFTENVKRSLCSKLENNIKGEAGNLACALLLGERNALSNEVKRDFSRSGIFHILSLSGLHLAVLTGFFDFILRKMRVSKLIRSFVIPPFIFAYLALTGFSLSTVRAAIMLCVVYLTFVLAMPADSPTVLFFTGFVILLFSPSSIADLGFLMSFFATFGVILVSLRASEKRVEKIRRKKDLGGSEVAKKIYRFFNKVLNALQISIAANSTILFLNYFCFGEISLVFPLTNLLFSPFVIVHLISSIASLAFNFIPLLQNSAVFVAELSGNVLINGCAFFSDIKNVSLSLNYPFAPYIIFFMTVSILILVSLRLKRKYLIMLPPIVASLAFAICVVISSHLGATSSDLIYLNVKENDFLVITNNSCAVICDFSNGTYSNVQSAFEAAKEECATELDTFILTHYHNKQTTSLTRLASNVKIRHLSLPYPKSNEDVAIFSELVNIAKSYGIEVFVYNYGDELTLFTHGKLKICEPLYLDRSVQATLCAEYSFGSQKAIYIGSSYPEASYDNYLALTDSKDFIIYGSHGPNPKSRFVLPHNALEVIFADEELEKLSYVQNAQALSSADIVSSCKYKKLEFQLQK